MKSILIAVGLSLGMTQNTAAQPLPEVSVGRIERLANFPSRHVDPRHVDVWLPADYSPAKPYAVLYMHDGQMLYDARTTWNRQAWDVHLAVDRLVGEGRIPDTLIVGIWNNGPQRYAEYFPQKMLTLAPDDVRREYIDKAQNGRPQADAYLRFLVEELKPAIDRRYTTRRGPEGSFLLGSSMGGLISLYALCEYPAVFGGAAGLSTHWIGRPTTWGLDKARNGALPLAALNYLSRHLPPAGRHRVYVDRGTDTLDALYAPALALVDEVLRDRGYSADDAMTRVFDGQGHNERDWAARVEIPLLFLMGGVR